MAGEVFASGSYRWASGEELLAQVEFLSSQNKKAIPCELQALYFKTVVWIPLQNGTGVLEIGTNELVKETAGMLSHILKSVDGLALQVPSMTAPITISSFEARIDTEAVPNYDGKQYGDLEKQHNSASMVESFGGRGIMRHPSVSSSYPSVSSKSSSTPSASDQKGNSSSTNFLMNTKTMEDSPASSLQVTPKSTVNIWFDEFHIPNQSDHIDMQEPDSYQAASHFPHDRHLHLSDFPLGLPSRYVVSSPLPSPMDTSRYASPHGEGNADNKYLLDDLPHPMQCGYIVCNEQGDIHNCLNEIVARSPSEMPHTECQTNTCDQLQVFATHSASDIHNQQQRRWKCTLPGVNDTLGEGMNDLLQQSAQDMQAMVSTIALTEQSFAYGSLQANLGHEIIAEQGVASMIDNEGSTSRNRKFIAGVSSTNSEGHGGFVDEKASADQIKEEMVAVSTLRSTAQAAATYVSYAPCSEANKAAGSTRSTSDYFSYGSGSADDYEVAGFLKRQAAAAYASILPEGGKVGVSLTSQTASNPVSYVSGSAEAEKGARSSAMISSGNMDNQYRVQQVSEFVGLQQARQGVQDDQYVTVRPVPQESNVSFGAQNDPAVHHMYAERDRRRKQGHCINTLRNLVPNITKKHSKVAVLERTVDHLKELKNYICELEQQKVDLMNTKFKDQRKLAEDSSHCSSTPQHGINVKHSIQDISNEENATCHYFCSSHIEDTTPHFQLKLIKNVQDVKANATIIEILNSLQNKNLCCYEIDYEFCKSTNKLSVYILANYKDRGNQCPTMDEIEGIKEWWKHLLKD